MKAKRRTKQALEFKAELVTGHKGATAFLVPFDPEEAWGLKPLRLAGRRHGWLVEGAVNGQPFASYVGERWGRFFLCVHEFVLAQAKVTVGDVASVTLSAAEFTPGLYAMAVGQSKSTTQPGRARADALVPKSDVHKPLDFERLKKSIAAACAEAFRDVKKKYPKESICSFALYSDDGAMTVCPAFDLASALAVRQAGRDENERAVEKFYPPEWRLEMVGAEKAFRAISATVRHHVLAVGTEAEFNAFRKKLFGTCLDVLEHLRPKQPGILLMFAVSDTDESAAAEIKMIKRLNPGLGHVEEFTQWLKRSGLS